MSVPATEPQVPEGEAAEAIELPPQGDAAFSALMDALAPEDDATSTGAADPATAPARTPDGSAAPAGEAAAASAEPAAGEPAAGAGEPGVPPAGGAADPATAADSGGGDLPADWTASSAELIPRFGELSTQLEENTAKAYHQDALAAVQTDHARYFQELNKHPRLLIGQEVPKIGGAEGEMETLHDTNDAREWQDAVKQILVDEVRTRASKDMEDNSDFLTTVHSSIELFQNNVDLVPGTKEFDIELANRFTEMMEPYELVVDGKLHGYSIPVQPIINRLRTDLTALRASVKADGTPAAKAKPAAAAPPAAEAPPVDGPQAGLQSKAGSSADTEEYSTLFGTIGLPNLRI